MELKSIHTPHSLAMNVEVLWVTRRTYQNLTVKPKSD